MGPPGLLQKMGEEKPAWMTLATKKYAPNPSQNIKKVSVYDEIEMRKKSIRQITVFLAQCLGPCLQFFQIKPTRR